MKVVHDEEVRHLPCDTLQECSVDWTGDAALRPLLEGMAQDHDYEPVALGNYQDGYIAAFGVGLGVYWDTTMPSEETHADFVELGDQHYNRCWA